MKASVCGDLSLAVGVRVFVVLFTPFHLFDKLKDVQPIQAESSFEKILTGTKINRFFTTHVKSKYFGKSHDIEVKVQKCFYKSCTTEKKYKDIRVKSVKPVTAPAFAYANLLFCHFIKQEEVLPQEREVTGTLMTFFLALGLSCGTSLSFLFKALL
ncbi:hypothetical protein MJT46_005945 [Ovis ammon polii x Ovis aries]|nr:hypothetical protein MJT46_005945 [Ovis ammon polii x Ovis aries]